MRKAGLCALFLALSIAAQAGPVRTFTDRPLPVLPPAASTLATPAPAAAIAILERIEFHGTKSQRAFLRQMTERMLESPTALRYADRLAQTDAKIDVSLAAWDGSQISFEKGRKVLNGRLGYSIPTERGAAVEINRLFSEADPAWTATAAPSVLAHEILGHGLHRREARAVGLDPFYKRYWGNEQTAKLIGWTVALELDQTGEGGAAWDYFKHPRNYARGLQSIDQAYALSYSRAEARRLTRAMSRRLAGVSWAQRRYEEKTRAYQGWRRTIDDLIAKDARPKTAFASLRKEIEDWLGYWIHLQQSFRKIQSAVLERQRWLKTAEGRAWQRDLRRNIRDPFFDSGEREIVELERGLRAAASGPRPARDISEPGQVTWRQLAALKAAHTRWGRRSQLSDPPDQRAPAISAQGPR